MHPEIASRLLHTRNLPSPSGAALRMIALAENPNAELAEVAQVLSRDAALAAKIMRIANSSLYGSQRRVDNLRQALTVLGLNAALTLALGFVLTRSLRSPDATGSPDMTLIWQRAALAATACRVLATRLRMPRGEELMLAGLLQDLGMLALAHLEPRIYAGVLQEATDDAHLRRLEREHFEADHVEIGIWMARQWSLPDYLVEAIDGSDGRAGTGTFATCVAASALVADIWLRDDPVAARRVAGQMLRERLGLDRGDFAEVLAQVSTALPEINALFELERQGADPERVETILEHARELIILRNLHQLQESTRRAQESERLADRARALEEQSRRDPLTGLYNRMRLEEVLRDEFESAARFGWPLSVAFLDLDDFKLINDRFGHLVGDDVLRAFAAVVTHTLRGSDIVARYGGEEFLLVLPGTATDAASAVLQRLVEIISQTPMAEADGEIVHITVSAGLATQGGNEQYDSIEALLRAADEALYDAKRAGRNRLMREPRPPSPPGA